MIQIFLLNMEPEVSCPKSLWSLQWNACGLIKRREWNIFLLVSTGGGWALIYSSSAASRPAQIYHSLIFRVVQTGLVKACCPTEALGLMESCTPSVGSNKVQSSAWLRWSHVVHSGFCQHGCAAEHVFWQRILFSYWWRHWWKRSRPSGPAG